MNTTQTAKIPILTYHSIDESGSVISTRPEIFRKQMQFLSEADFNVVSLKTLTKYLCKNCPIPPNTIALTFDDGFQNFYSEAFPVLQEFRQTATVFLITDYCGKYNDWYGNLPTLERSKLLAWDEIKELSSYGIEFGAHTLTHPNLTRLNMKEVEREIVQSKLTIEDRLGMEVTNFAYPYGKYNVPVKQITEKHFSSACSVRLGKVQPGSDLFALERLDTYYLSNERVFRLIPSASLDWYLSFRQAMRDLKELWYKSV